ncbi:SDR family oxidoreductase [Streptomyces sp. NPDC088727]|uniref:SDR family oxidoreductase n=1 Tax=Streptomyces sp. NPDC088727 TaxID=3365875 RepID=UPI00381758AB
MRRRLPRAVLIQSIGRPPRLPASTGDGGQVPQIAVRPHRLGAFSHLHRSPSTSTAFLPTGLYSLARTVAAEYAADGIRMNVVAGGAISTAVNAGPSDEWVPEIPAGRYGTSEEMAAAAVYLASDEARYITSQQIVLDGGVSVRGPFPE